MELLALVARGPRADVEGEGDVGDLQREVRDGEARARAAAAGNRRTRAGPAAGARGRRRLDSGAGFGRVAFGGHRGEGQRVPRWLSPRNFYRSPGRGVGTRSHRSEALETFGDRQCGAMRPCSPPTPWSSKAASGCSGHLGSGGMGEVYLGEQVSLGRKVAIKVLHHDLHQQPGMAERFKREARLLSAVEHPAVVRIIDFGESGRRRLPGDGVGGGGEPLRAAAERSAGPGAGAAGAAPAGRGAGGHPRQGDHPPGHQAGERLPHAGTPRASRRGCWTSASRGSSSRRPTAP